ncbi:MAG: hypothetical protein WA240_08710 [Nitrospirota bacterium]|jgi:YD repeat-containing protein
MLTYNGQPLSNDDNGNLIQRQTSVGPVTYTWDAKNQLVHIQWPNGVARRGNGVTHLKGTCQAEKAIPRREKEFLLP